MNAPPIVMKSLSLAIELVAMPSKLTEDMCEPIARRLTQELDAILGFVHSSEAGCWRVVAEVNLRDRRVTVCVEPRP